MKIYVGNLSYEVTEEDLRQEFMPFGEVTSVSIRGLALLKWLQSLKLKLP